MHRVGMEEVDDLVRRESPISSRLVDVNLEEVVKVTAHAVPWIHFSVGREEILEAEHVLAIWVKQQVVDFLGYLGHH